MHGIFFCQASTMVRLVRVSDKVWGASFDVLPKNKRPTFALVFETCHEHYLIVFVPTTNSIDERGNPATCSKKLQRGGGWWLRDCADFCPNCLLPNPNERSSNNEHTIFRDEIDRHLSVSSIWLKKVVPKKPKSRWSGLSRVG